MAPDGHFWAYEPLGIIIKDLKQLCESSGEVNRTYLSGFRF
jgi:hypothetical protein